MMTRPSKTIQARGVKARNTQQKRFEQYGGIYTNAMMPSSLLKEVCYISTIGEKLLKTAMERLGLSARAYDRILKVARTIADLAGSKAIQEHHLAEAIHYRSLDRQSWGA